MRNTLILICTIPLLSLVSCVATRDLAYQPFAEQENYRQTYQVYENKEVVKTATEEPSKKEVVVDLENQRAQLLVNGLVALDAPCTTGKEGKETPVGEYTVLEKIEDKQSNLFGKLYDKEGNLLFKGDRRKFEGEYETYEGFSIPFWMRMNYNGIGMHQSGSIKRQPASNGCVRLPANAVKKIFDLADVGTTVKVVSKKRPPTIERLKKMLTFWN